MENASGLFLVLLPSDAEMLVPTRKNRTGSSQPLVNILVLGLFMLFVVMSLVTETNNCCYGHKMTFQIFLIQAGFNITTRNHCTDPLWITCITMRFYCLHSFLTDVVTAYASSWSSCVREDSLRIW